MSERNLRFAVQIVHDVSKMNIQRYTAENDLDPISTENNYRLSDELVQKIRSFCTRYGFPIVWGIVGRAYYIAIREQNEALHLLGPALATASTSSPSAEREDVSRHLQIQSGVLHVPFVSATIAAFCASVYTYLVTGEIYSIDSIYHVNSQFGILYMEDWILHRTVNAENEKTSYEQEKNWLMKIAAGISIYDERHLTWDDIPSFIGKFSMSSKKQAEYNCLAGIILASRVAIRGGVAPQVVYEFSDAYLQQLSECDTPAAILQLCVKASNHFSNTVRRAQNERATNNLIDHCKLYVDRSLYEKITVGSIADYLGVSSNYLSAVFSRDTGETLTRYIHGKRLDRARELLRYSTMPVSEISEMLQFSSQSHFCKLFKQEYGRTPGEYRRIHAPRKII